MEGLFKNVITNLESITSANEGKIVKIQKEFDRKNQILEENLRKLTQH